MSSTQARENSAVILYPRRRHRMPQSPNPLSQPKKALVEERGEGRLRRSMAVIGRENRMRLRFRAWSPSCKILGDLPSKQPSQLKLRFRRGKENEHLSPSFHCYPSRAALFKYSRQCRHFGFEIWAFALDDYCLSYSYAQAKLSWRLEEICT